MIRHGIVQKISFIRTESRGEADKEVVPGDLVVEVGESTEQEEAWARRMIILERYPVTEQLLKVSISLELST